jgi:hypothetical protein
MPNEGEFFYIVREGGDVGRLMQSPYSPECAECIEFNNYFKTIAQAEEAERRVRQVLSDYQDELLNGPTARETVWNRLAKFHEWFHGGGYEKIVAVALAASIVLGVATIIRKSLCSQ